jgi:hypothetical protein
MAPPVSYSPRAQPAGGGDQTSVPAHGIAFISNILSVRRSRLPSLIGGAVRRQPASTIRRPAQSFAPSVQIVRSAENRPPTRPTPVARTSTALLAALWSNHSTTRPAAGPFCRYSREHDWRTPDGGVTAAHNLLNSAAALVGAYASIRVLPAALPFWLVMVESTTRSARSSAASTADQALRYILARAVRGEPSFYSLV